MRAFNKLYLNSSQQSQEFKKRETIKLGNREKFNQILKRFSRKHSVREVKDAFETLKENKDS